jgi:Ca2+-binding RTX toxin-like protein
MFTVLCALPAAGVVPAAIAQEDDDEDENLASSIVSEVLDNSGDAEDESNQEATNTAAEDSNQEQVVNQEDISTLGDDTADVTGNQREANIAVPLAIPLDIDVTEEAPPTPPPPPQEEEDTTPPTLAVPAGIVVEATSAQGAVVRYGVSATDNVDGTVTLAEDGTITQDNVGGDIAISCTPVSGSTFPIGTTTVNCEATDAAGNTVRNSFTVTVNAAPDTTAPEITVPAGIVVEATSAQGAVVTYRVTAQDNVDGTATLDEGNVLTQDGIGGDIAIICSPSSGSTFPIGGTVVVCTATDEADNTATASFTVTVADTTSPVISGVPADITVEATSSSGATVSYTPPTATDAVDGSVPVTCTPQSGSTFPIGTTTVTCTATDEAGNRATASFTVTVNPITCRGIIATIVGTPGDDDIEGTEGMDVIAALEGDDTVNALGGDDLICGGEGNDIMDGGAGNDIMFGEAGADLMFGGDGADTFDGGAGNDVMIGGAGNDDMFGGAGNDEMIGGAGNDEMIGGAGNDSADGGPNTDSCNAETETNCEV